MFALQDLITKSRSQPPMYDRVLALDPGETTGWCTYIKDAQPSFQLSQYKTWPLEDHWLQFITKIHDFAPQALVFESYNIYEWKADEHKRSNVPTLQVIGALKGAAIERRLPWFTQTPQNAKAFVTDDKLRQWGLWVPAVKHGRDAARHAVYFLLFGP